MLQALDLDAREDPASGRIQVGRLRGAAPGRARSIPGEGSRSARPLPRSRRLAVGVERRARRVEIGDRPAAANATRPRSPEAPLRAPSSARRARASSIPARRSSSSLVIDRPGANRATTARTLRPDPVTDGAAASSDCRLTGEPVAELARFSFRVPSVRGSSSPGHRVARRIFWWSCGGRWRRARPRRGPCPRRARRSAWTRSADPPATGAPTTAESRTPGCVVERLLDVLGKDVQPFGRDNHFLLAAADVRRPWSSNPPMSPV